MQTPQALPGSTAFPFSVQNLCPMPVLFPLSSFFHTTTLQSDIIICSMPRRSFLQNLPIYNRLQSVIQGIRLKKSRTRQRFWWRAAISTQRCSSSNCRSACTFLFLPASAEQTLLLHQPPRYPLAIPSIPAPQPKPLLSRGAPSQDLLQYYFLGGKLPFPAASCCSSSHGARFHHGHPCIWGPRRGQPGCPARSLAETPSPPFPLHVSSRPAFLL